MFTGLVQHMARVREIVPQDPGVRLVIEDPLAAPSASVGDSIAINGCCLTVVAVNENCLAFEAGPETMQRTSFGQLSAGDSVNIETSLRVGDELGGHLVTGHVDALGTVAQREDEAEWSTFWISVPRELSRQLASKGSIAVDGVSLTLVDVEDDRFSVALIPHTLHVTTLGSKTVGDHVNLETDVLAKYVERQLQWEKRLS
ncbi:MAG: riboflavin synthase [Planctomycetales bacterium]|nr:riboflavin synthase [Planctomycetales bacterium]